MGAREKFVVRQDPRWPDAHIRLSKLFKDRRPPGMSQERFGAEYGLGSQGMVWQYLNGYTPLNIEAAAKFAQGLRCTIKDISPEMDKVMRGHLLPALGLTAWGKTLALVLAVVGMLQATPTEARILHNTSQPQPVFKSLNFYTFRAWLCRVFGTWRGLAASF